MSSSPRIPLPDVPDIVKSRNDGEEEIWRTLLENKFEGLIADVVRSVLARLGVTVVMRLIRSGRIHHRSAAIGRPVPRNFSRRDAGVEGLANLVVAHALTLFQKLAIAGKGWNPRHEVSMAEYFVGTCMLVAAGARREWRPDFDPKYPIVEISQELEAPTEWFDHPDVQHLIWEWTGWTDPELCRILELRVLGYTHKEIAADQKTTDRAIEGKLTRLLKRLRHRSYE